MGKSRVYRFVDYLEKQSCGLVTVWPMGDTKTGVVILKIVYKDGICECAYHISRTEINLAVAEPEDTARFILNKLVDVRSMKDNGYHGHHVRPRGSGGA